MEVQNKKPTITIILKNVPTAPGNKFVPIVPSTFTYEDDDDHEYVQENIEVHKYNNIEYYFGQDLIDLTTNFFTKRNKRSVLAREITMRNFIDERFCFRGRYINNILTKPQKISRELDKLYVLRQYVDKNYDLARELFGEEFVIKNKIAKGRDVNILEPSKEFTNLSVENSTQNVVVNNITSNIDTMTNGTAINNETSVALDYVTIDGQEYVFARQLLARAPVFFYMCSNQKDLFELVPPSDALYVHKKGNVWTKSDNVDHYKDTVIILRSLINKYPGLMKEIDGVKDGLFGFDGMPLAKKEIKLKRNEKFVGIDSQDTKITTIGDRTFDGTLFLVSDIIRGFGVTKHSSILEQEGSVYITKKYNADTQTEKKKFQKERFVSFDRLIRAIFGTRNDKTKPYIDWIMRVIFVVQFGTIEQKKELISDVPETNTDIVRNDLTIQQQKIDHAKEIDFLRQQYQSEIDRLNNIIALNNEKNEQNQSELDRLNNIIILNNEKNKQKIDDPIAQNNKDLADLKDHLHSQSIKYEKMLSDTKSQYTEQLNELKLIIAKNDAQHEKQLNDLVSQQTIKDFQNDKKINELMYKHEKELNELKHQHNNTTHQFETQNNELKTLLASKDSLMTIKDLEHRLKLNEVLSEKYYTQQQPQQTQPPYQQPSNIRSNVQPHRQVQRKHKTNYIPPDQ